MWRPTRKGAHVHVKEAAALRYAEAFRTSSSFCLMSWTCPWNGISHAYSLITWETSSSSSSVLYTNLPSFFVLQILGKFPVGAVFNIMSIACPLCMLIKLSRNLKNVNYIVSFLTLIPLRISFTSLIRESLWAICFTCTHIHTIDTPSDTHITYTK